MQNAPTSKQSDATARPLDMEFLESLKNLKEVDPYSIKGRLHVRIIRAVGDEGNALPAPIEITKQNILDMLPPIGRGDADHLRTPFGSWRPPRFVMKLLRRPPRQSAATLWADLIHWLGGNETVDGVIGIPARMRVRITQVSEDLVRVEFLPPE